MDPFGTFLAAVALVAFAAIIGVTHEIDERRWRRQRERGGPASSTPAE